LTPEEWKFTYALSDIERWSRERNLTPEQVRRCFQAGIAAMQIGIVACYDADTQPPPRHLIWLEG